jgi:hypothetical protein
MYPAEVKLKNIHINYFDVFGRTRKKCHDVHVCTLGALGVSSLMCAIKQPLRGALRRVT